MVERSKDLLHEVLALGAAERAEVAARLIGSLDPVEPDSDYAQQWGREIEHRLSDIETGAVKPIPWEEARRVLRQIHGAETTVS